MLCTNKSFLAITVLTLAMAWNAAAQSGGPNDDRGQARGSSQSYQERGKAPQPMRSQRQHQADAPDHPDHHLGGHHGSGPSGAPRDMIAPGPNNRDEHLQMAIMHLRRAGRHDIAGALEHEARGGGRGRRDDGVEYLERQVQELRRHVERLSHVVQELEGRQVDREQQARREEQRREMEARFHEVQRRAESEMRAAEERIQDRERELQELSGRLDRERRGRTEPSQRVDRVEGERAREGEDREEEVDDSIDEDRAADLQRPD